MTHIGPYLSNALVIYKNEFNNYFDVKNATLIKIGKKLKIRQSAANKSYQNINMCPEIFFLNISIPQRITTFPSQNT